MARKITLEMWRVLDLMSYQGLRIRYNGLAWFADNNGDVVKRDKFRPPSRTTFNAMVARGLLQSAAGNLYELTDAGIQATRSHA